MTRRLAVLLAVLGLILLAAGPTLSRTWAGSDAEAHAADPAAAPVPAPGRTADGLLAPVE